MIKYQKKNSMIKQSDIDRFNSKIEKLESGCWVYTGYKNPKGYGVFKSTISNLAHRFSWIMHNGEIPKGLLVCHTCDFPPCIRIDHLWVGSPRDNTQDMVKKDRPRGARNPKKGEESATSKITNDQAFQIAKLIESGKTSKEISSELNISVHIINDISSNRTWKTLEFEKPKRILLYKNCLICNTGFKTKPYKFDVNKFCSHKCYSINLRKKSV